jgi:tetratricopeptide (TPR) repeat protein
MSLQKTNALIDHLDKDFAGSNDQVSPETAAATARMISEDEEAAKEWAYLKLAVDAVQEAGLYQQVAAVRQTWESQTENASDTPIQDHPPAENPSGGVVRNLYRNMMRAAAIILVVLAGGAIFKYVRLSSSSLYSEYYASYELNTSRGAAGQDAIEQAFTARNWTEVLTLSADAKTSSNKSEFLAGMADLELKRFDDAIAHFEQIIASNTHSGQDYFEDEAEYYLAMSWLAKRKVNEAMPILEKIRANKSHLYHDKVEKMSFTDLRLVQYKENK